MVKIKQKKAKKNLAKKIKRETKKKHAEISCHYLELKTKLHISSSCKMMSMWQELNN